MKRRVTKQYKLKLGRDDMRDLAYRTRRVGKISPELVLVASELVAQANEPIDTSSLSGLQTGNRQVGTL
jgi:hypothetical protein